MLQYIKKMTEQQKQIALAVGVVLVAVGIGFALGRRPAVMDQKQGTEATADVAPTSDATQPVANGAAAKPATNGGTVVNPSTSGSDQPIAAPAKTGLISLAAKSDNGGISFSWNIPKNLTSPFGYVIFKSKTSTPSFPRDEAKFISNPNARSYTWDIQDGGTYWFKMCTWNGKSQQQSGCLTSSNTVKATAPTASAAQQQSPFDYTDIELGLAGRAENDGVRLFWSQTTSPMFQSYKVVRSAIDTNPYYPKTAAVLTLTNKTDVSGFDTSATKGAKYWYRVCVVRTGQTPQCGNVWSVQY